MTSLIFKSTITVAFLNGQNSVALTFSLLSVVLTTLYAISSKYYLLGLTQTAYTWPSGPGKTSMMRPNIHFLFFRLPLLIVTTSGTFYNDVGPWSFLCLSLSTLIYCFLHPVYATSLHFLIVVESGLTWLTP